MNAGRLRKRVERLEQLLEPRLKESNLAETPTHEPLVDEFRLMWLRSRFPNITAEEKVELERMNALSPEDPSPPLTWEEVCQILEDEGRKEREAEKRRR